VNFPGVPRHIDIIPAFQHGTPITTRRYSDYISDSDRTETAVQDAMPTESYGNFGLTIITMDTNRQEQLFPVPPGAD
jgi:hypothetical protein